MRLILKISATNFACYLITYYLLQKITEINYIFLSSLQMGNISVFVSNGPISNICLISHKQNSDKSWYH